MGSQNIFLFFIFIILKIKVKGRRRKRLGERKVSIGKKIKKSFDSFKLIRWGSDLLDIHDVHIWGTPISAIIFQLAHCVFSFWHGMWEN